jgi:hypothetical protein
VSYDDKALRITHPLLSVTTSSTQTQSIKGPAGRKGVLVAINATVTTTTVGANIAVQVGDGTTATKYGSLAIGAQTAPEALSTEARTRNATTGVLDYIPADQEVVVTFVAGTSGVIVPSVVVDWF